MKDIAQEIKVGTKSDEGVEGANRGDERSLDSPNFAKRSARACDRLAFWLVVVVIGIAFVLHLGMVTPGRFGGYYDDTIYVTAAKSLATGEGYRMISLPQPVAQTLVPPFYPFVLSLVWRVDPRFPENLTAMMVLSVVAALGFVALTWLYFVEHEYATRWQALVVVALAAINWRVMLLATSVLSEVAYALLSAATLYSAERLLRDRRSSSIGGIVGSLAALAFLTRTSGVVLLVAIAAYFVLRRQWRRALLPVAIGAAVVVTWLAWCYMNRTEVGGEHASYYAGYLRGVESTLGNLQSVNHTSRLSVHLDIIRTNAIGLLLVSVPLECLGLRYDLAGVIAVPLVIFASLLFAAGFLTEVRKGVRLLHVYLFFYLLLHVVVPGNSYDRYLMPVVPFLLLFLVRELSAIVSFARGAIAADGKTLTKVVVGVVGLLLLSAGGVVFYSNSSGIYRALTLLKNTGRIEEDAQAIAWIKSNTDPSDVLVCYRDQLYHLYTNRRAVRSIPVVILDTSIYQTSEPAPDDLSRVFAAIIRQNKPRYLVLNATDFKYQSGGYGEVIKEMIRMRSDVFVSAFESPDGRSSVYQINADRITDDL